MPLSPRVLLPVLVALADVALFVRTLQDIRARRWPAKVLRFSLASFAALLALGLSVRLTRPPAEAPRRPSAAALEAEPPASPWSALAADESAEAPPEAPPDSVDEPGLVGRKIGRMRVYLAVESEIDRRIEATTLPAVAAPPTDCSALLTGCLPGVSRPRIDLPARDLESVPILVVLENDSYSPLDPERDLAAQGEEIFTLSIRSAGGEEVFVHHETSEGPAAWEPAERKTFLLQWPARDLAPGEYVVSLQPAFGEALELPTSVR